jgi:hypothetical protein
MRLVSIPTSFVSALTAPAAKPAAVIDAWLDGKSTLLACAAHADELRATATTATREPTDKTETWSYLGDPFKIARSVSPLWLLNRLELPGVDLSR